MTPTPEIDPNAALRDLRDAASRARIAADGDSNDTEIETLQEVMEHAEALDEWLTAGGSLPSRWVRMKTFAYQLGETFGAEDCARGLRDGMFEATDVSATAQQLAQVNYPEHGDPSREEFASGYRAGWERQATIPPFLYHAPLSTPVIVTEATLQSALEAALPAVNVLGFHHTLAQVVIDHVTRNGGER
ncbi:hypothetical protein ACIA49_39160 [Kribbella sp. NPDC051587]|uniref:hypothetical protein n=1 Tax=Kribbella sp. NPDC051587 TaxID=3364119 RepID=UPI0037B75529